MKSWTGGSGRCTLMTGTLSVWLGGRLNRLSRNLTLGGDLRVVGSEFAGRLVVFQRACVIPGPVVAQSELLMRKPGAEGWLSTDHEFGSAAGFFNASSYQKMAWGISPGR